METISVRLKINKEKLDFFIQYRIAKFRYNVTVKNNYNNIQFIDFYILNYKNLPFSICCYYFDIKYRFLDIFAYIVPILRIGNFHVLDSLALSRQVLIQYKGQIRKLLPKIHTCLESLLFCESFSEILHLQKFITDFIKRIHVRNNNKI